MWTLQEGRHLAIVDGKVQMVEGVMRGPVDDFFERVAGDHVRVVYLHRR
jgi:hypothetical protein